MRVRSARELGLALRRARRQRRMTQAELASALGTTQRWVSEAEGGKPTVQVGRILRALAFLGVAVDLGDGPGEWHRLKEPSDLHSVDVDAIVDRRRKP